LHQWLAEYFPPRPAAESAQEWTDKPVPEWSGPQDDTDLINRALRSRGAMAVFGGKASFADLYLGNADALSRAFPPQSDAWPWDRSGADIALANHLAFWTGNDCARMLRIMRSCKLYRDKWEREDYLPNTILRACASQREWYKGKAEQPQSVQPVP